jgi:hypothetical protein
MHINTIHMPVLVLASLVFLLSGTPSPAKEPGGSTVSPDRAAPSGFRESIPAHPGGKRRPVSFVAEEISLKIAGSRVSVTGRYLLQSDLPDKRAIPLAYPFPVGGAGHYPDTIRVFRGKDLAPVPFDEDRKQAAVFFRIEGEGDVEFTAYYSQKLRKREATYILTTTKEWGAPLQSATFHVTLPDSLIPIFWSYLPDRSERSGNQVTYIIHRTNFLPERDMIVRWKPRTERQSQ